MKFSVVILTYNRARLLEACLEALRAQSRRADEIVVVDNASTDSTRELLAKLGGEAGPERRPPLLIKVVEGASAGGWAASRNKGVQAASCDWIVMTDDDCLPAGDWLARIERLAEAGYDAVGGLVEPATDLPYPWWWHPEMAWAVGLSVPGHRGPLAGSVYYPQTANLAVRRDVLLAEPFQEIAADFAADPDIYRAGREDAELWRRLRRKGFRTRFERRLVVRHQVEASRLAFRRVAARAFQDGVALQRREPRRELALQAIDTVVGLPDDVIAGVLHGGAAPWRMAAGRLIWAVRQWGQWVEFRRREGWLRAAALLASASARCAAKRTAGIAKRAGRRAGIALIRVKRPVPNHAARSIVVATAGYLGDMVLLHPFLTALRSQRPETTITLLCKANGAALYAQDPSVSRIVALDPEAESGAAAPRLIRSTLCDCRADLVLVPYFHGVSSAPLFSRSRARVATFAEQVGFSRRWWYDRADTRIDKPAGRPESDNLLRLFAEAGVRGPIEQTPLAFLPSELQETSDFLRARGLDRFRLVVLAPGTNKSEKMWPEERWAGLVRHLAREYDLDIAMAPAPNEIPLCRRIAELSQCDVHLWEDLGVRQLALVLAEARLAVCCDNGAKHLAVAMETPTLTLYGPTDERQWGAMFNRRRHGAVRGCVWDLTPEERLGLPPDHQMRCIALEQVLRALDEMLSER
jgi:ADP-heptose:LPS heptosyltransferase